MRTSLDDDELRLCPCPCASSDLVNDRSEAEYPAHGSSAMIGRLLAEQADVDVPGRLPNEIDPFDPDRPRALLGAMMQGFSREA